MKKRKGTAAMTAAKRKAISAAGGKAKAAKRASVGCPGCREAASEHDDSCKAWPKAWV